MSPETSHPDIHDSLLSNMCPLPSQDAQTLLLKESICKCFPEEARLRVKHSPRRKVTPEDHQRMGEIQVQFSSILGATQIHIFDSSEEWFHPLAIHFLDIGSTDFSVVL